jgi:hypothetical protein
MANGKLIPMRLGCLYSGKFIVEAKTFYCPSNKIPLYMYESYTDPTKWGTLPQNYNIVGPPPNQNQWVRVGYIYYPVDSKPEKRATEDVPLYVGKKIDKLDPRLPYMTDMMRHKEELCHKTRNIYALHALFGDGHVLYCNDQAVFTSKAWDDWENGGMADFQKFFYTIFKIIAKAK